LARRTVDPWAAEGPRARLKASGLRQICGSLLIVISATRCSRCGNESSGIIKRGYDAFLRMTGEIAAKAHGQSGVTGPPMNDEIFVGKNT